MDQAELYSNFNDHQRVDTELFLDEYLPLLKWNDDAVAMDIGCGSGNITSTVLLPKLPDSVRRLIGSDVCAEMIDFASANFQVPKVEFCLGDIGAKNIDPDWHGSFDHLFSFYCLHWVQNYKQCVRNMYDMLKPGGDIFLIHLVYAPIVESYEKLEKSPKWEKYLTETQTYTQSYNNWKNIDAVRNLLTDAGFSIQICDYKSRKHTYENIDTFKKFMKSVNPFVSKIPDDLHEDYMNDMLNANRHAIFIEDNRDYTKARVILPSKVIVVIASKKSI